MSKLFIYQVTFLINMKYLKAFMAGVALPVIICPFIFMWLAYSGNINVLEHIPMYFIPMIWGLWNVLLIAIGKNCIIKNVNMRQWVHGGLLGLLIALVGLYIFKIDMALFGISLPQAYWMLLVAPITYGFVWRYVVLPLNKMVKV